MELELEYTSGEYFTVEFDFSRGSYGTYFDPPEPHDVEIYAVYDEDGVETKDVKIFDYFDEVIYDKINRGDFD